MESNNKHFPQTAGSAQAPHMSFSKADIAIESFHKKVPQYCPSVIG